MKTERYFNLSCLIVCCFFLSACTLTPGGNRTTLDNPWSPRADSAQQAEGVGNDSNTNMRQRSPESARRYAGETQAQPAATQPVVEVYEGNDVLINLSQKEGESPPAEGDITLTFQGADIAEVVKTILGDILQLNYVIDDNVRGTVHLKTSRPLTLDELVPTLETLLHINGAVLLKTQNFYEIRTSDSAPGGSIMPGSRLKAGKGYQVLIMPLRYIASSEMLKILEPIKPRQGLIEVDSRRNLMIVAGTSEELSNIRETVRIFDVDQLQGMSVGLFRLQSSEAEVMLDELEAIFGDSADGPLAGLVRFVSIERLNAVLVITPQKKYLRDARVWINRLDRSEDVYGKNMYVYYVQNGKAENLSNMLGQLFDDSRNDSSRRQQAGNASVRQTDADENADASTADTSSRTSSRNNAVRSTESGSSLNVDEVSIIADEENNALLIMASANDYDKVRKAIEKLDVLPLQVLVEATIVEVSLSDELRYGLQWFFKTSLDSGKKSGIGSVGNLPIVTPSDFFPTANFEIFDAVGTRLLLNTLAEDSKLNVISSPSLMVLDNHTATIRVGDQVPVRTSETTATSSDNLNSTSTIQFKDTGVLLEVTPRVNAGGMVVLDIKQEVNDVDRTTTSLIDSPTIIQRQIETSVAVQSGETLVLGGLIKENRSRSSGGVPGLRHVPVMGWLFGSEGKSVDRTELVVMITPTAVSDQEEARDVTREYQQKLREIKFAKDSNAYQDLQ